MWRTLCIQVCKGVPASTAVSLFSTWLSPARGRKPAVWGRTHEASGGSASGSSYTYLSYLSPTLPLRQAGGRRGR